MKSLSPPLSESACRSLKAGEWLLLNGVIYTARDMAHRRFIEALDSGEGLPFDADGAVIYFVGPTPARPGHVIGAAGPTTSSRMDDFSVRLTAGGVRATIGKGYRSDEVRKGLKRYGAVHLSATGGAGALLSKHVVEADVIAYEDLGPEAVRRLKVFDFPAVVAYDAYGGSIYKEN